MMQFMPFCIEIVLPIGFCRVICHYCINTSYDIMGLKSHGTYNKYTKKVHNEPEFCNIHLDVVLKCGQNNIGQKCNIILLLLDILIHHTLKWSKIAVEC